jgi:hypothetical protein
MVDETRWTSARAVYIEVQNKYVGTDEQWNFDYTGGVAFAIGPRHLLTALHIVQPTKEFLKDLESDSPCFNKILELDPFFVLEEDQKPEETDRWKLPTEYTILHVLEDLDVALLHTQKTHLVTPICLKPLYSGLSHIYTLDLRNYFCQQAHCGRCWSVKNSAGGIYYFDSLAYCGFSGGPVLSISLIDLC